MVLCFCLILEHLHLCIIEKYRHQFVYNCANLQVCYNNCVNLSDTIYFTFSCLFFLCISRRREWIVIVVCEEKRIIKRSRKINILMKCSVK